MSGQAKSDDKLYVISASAVVDGTGREPIQNASVVVKGDKIVHVGKTSELDGKYSNAKKIEASGKTIMPGMVECHFHMYMDTGYATAAQTEIDLTPMQWIVLTAARACGVALKCGYTSVVGAGTAHNVDFWVREAINKRIVRGPRVLPASREISSTGGTVDWSPSYWKLGVDGLSITVDGPYEALKAARKVMKDGAEIVKIFPSGEGFLIGKYHPYFHDARREREVMTFEEINAITQETHRWNRLVMAHCRNIPSVKNCLNAGVDIINHATSLDDECYRLFKEKPPLAVCPSIGFTWFTMKQDWNNKEFVKEAAYEEEFNRGVENMKRLHKMGIRIVPGGDYGQSDIPHGLYAKDLEIFVDYLEFTPLETLGMATKEGSYLMRMPDKIGTLEVGKNADLLVIDGDPIADISILQNTAKILMVMKDGEVQASRGKLLSPDWDMLDEDNFGLMQKTVSGEGRIPVAQYQEQ
jgi:imidazolonepropionase-like amidohydrolase